MSPPNLNIYDQLYGKIIWKDLPKADLQAYIDEIQASEWWILDNE